MPLAEQLYLGLVITAFISFAILIATLSWLDVKAGKAPAKVKARTPAPAVSGKLGVGHA